MPRRLQSRAKEIQYRVTLEQGIAPDAEARLGRAVDLILQAAARAESSQQQSAEPTQENIPGGATQGCPSDRGSP